MLLSLRVYVRPQGRQSRGKQAFGLGDTKLIGEEVAYISLIMQALRALCGDITIDGYSDHPILRMARA